VTDAAGAVVELKPIPYEWVSVQMLTNGRLCYDVTEITSIYGGQGRMRRLLDHEVFHLRDRTDDGLLGKSRLQRAASVIRAGLSVQDFAESMYRNGANPSGAVELDNKLSPEARQQLGEAFKSFQGTSNAAKVMILDQGLTWKQISVSPEDAELLASRRFTTEELARIFQVPPPLVGIWDHSSFTNSETAGKWFGQFTIGPWCRKIESEFRRSIFSAEDRGTYSLELDLSGFLRGDHAARWAGHKIAIEAGILNSNEIRELEGWNAREGGDEFQGTIPSTT
jgi:HK97 family phage portal protein